MLFLVVAAKVSGPCACSPGTSKRDKYASGSHPTFLFFLVMFQMS